MQQCRLCRAVKTSSEELYKLMNSARALSLLGKAVEVDRPIFRPPAAIFVCCEEALQVRLSGTNRRITASVSRNNGPAKSPRICVILFQESGRDIERKCIQPRPMPRAEKRFTTNEHTHVSVQPMIQRLS